MPKVSVASSAALTQTSIETMMAPVDYVLSGRLDNDNLYYDFTNAIQIPSSKIVNYADNTRIIINDKFFGHDATENTIREQVLDPVVDAMENNIRYILLSDTQSYNLTDENSTIVTNYKEIPKAVDIMPVKIDDEYQYFFNYLVDKDYSGDYDFPEPTFTVSHDKIVVNYPVDIFTSFGSTEFMNVYIQFFILCEQKI